MADYSRMELSEWVSEFVFNPYGIEINDKNEEMNLYQGIDALKRYFVGMHG